jgi:hypothetical protein
MATAIEQEQNGGATMLALPGQVQDTDSGAISPFASTRNFESAQRAAKALGSSTLVPKEYQGNIANCLVAMELANRTGASVLLVMQNLHVIQGRPSWSAAFWTRVYAPEISLGMHTMEEHEDIGGTYEPRTAGARDLNAALKVAQPAAIPAETNGKDQPLAPDNSPIDDSDEQRSVL